MSKELAELLFPDIKQTPSELFEKRWDNQGKNAFRIAPSPTGQMHIGTLGMTLCDYMLAKSTGGKCFIRIEDTDQKREVDSAAMQLLTTLKTYGIVFDNEPFYQSKRTEIYQTFAKDLVARGHAYPCFCSEKDLEQIRENQQSRKLRTGYYAEYAKCRNLSIDEIKQKIKNKQTFVLRMNFQPKEERVTWQDMVRGQMSLPAEVNNAVILKSNGMPPYNLAAAVDDIMMGVTHIVRGEEWLASTAEHIQLYCALGHPHPHYAHMPVICVMEGESKRKLSKRKDKEALAQNFLDQGYPKEALIEYLLTLYNTDFEPWRLENSDKPWREFNFRFEKIGSNSPLFDWDKLNDISKNIIANMTCDQINREIQKYYGDKFSDEQYEKIFTLLAIDRGTPRPRKDIAKYSEIETVFDYIFKPVKMTPLLEKYAVLVKTNTSREQWFASVKEKAQEFGFKNVKEFTQSIRIALTGREFSTDLYTISKILLCQQ